jgi:hypothetical protein
LARTWLQVEVVLAGAAEDERRDPGRVFLVGPKHTFGQLADAINAAFARWGPVAPARVSAGRRASDRLSRRRVRARGRLGRPGGSQGRRRVNPGDQFEFRFDFGAGWRHRCRVLADKADPREDYGPGRLPARPVAIWGWGWIPDQYGRETAADGDE